jgi:hypothetical protein
MYGFALAKMHDQKASFLRIFLDEQKSAKKKIVMS